MKCRLRIYGDPVLRQQAREVDVFDDRLRELAEDMFAVMYAEHGVGLAAPQVGQPLAMAVIDPRPLDEGTKPFVILNPRLVETRGEFCFEEGCLSIPDIRVDLVRPDSVVVEGVNLVGKPFHVEASGVLGRILQHEIDHLNGMLFIDRLGTIRQQMIAAQLEEIERSRKQTGG